MKYLKKEKKLRIEFQRGVRREPEEQREEFPEKNVGGKISQKPIAD